MREKTHCFTGHRKIPHFIGEIDFSRNLACVAKKQPHDTVVSCGCCPTKRTSLSGAPLGEGLLSFGLALSR